MFKKRLLLIVIFFSYFHIETSGTKHNRDFFDEMSEEEEEDFSKMSIAHLFLGVTPAAAEIDNNDPADDFVHVPQVAKPLYQLTITKGGKNFRQQPNAKPNALNYADQEDDDFVEITEKEASQAAIKMLEQKITNGSTAGYVASLLGFTVAQGSTMVIASPIGLALGAATTWMSSEQIKEYLMRHNLPAGAKKIDQIQRELKRLLPRKFTEPKPNPEKK